MSFGRERGGFFMTQGPGAMDQLVGPMLLALASVGCGSSGSPPSSALEGGADGEVVTREPDAGDDAAPPGDAADAGYLPCTEEQTGTTSAMAAKSAGFTGTAAAYYGLYTSSCRTAADCAAACVAAGGTTTSCSAGSQCVDGSDCASDCGDAGSDAGLSCLPPTYWLEASAALSASGMTDNAAEIILVQNPYEDALVLTNFGVNVPDGVTITGIQFGVRRASIVGYADDGTIQVLKNGSPVGTNHAQNDSWPTSLAYAEYGGSMDTWGVTWTPDEIRSSGFGVSIAPQYTGPASGNEHAYIDSVRVTVYFETPCP